MACGSGWAIEPRRWEASLPRFRASDRLAAGKGGAESPQRSVRCRNQRTYRRLGSTDQLMPQIVMFKWPLRYFHRAAGSLWMRPPPSKELRDQFIAAFT